MGIFEISRNFNASTAHISQEDNSLLGDGSAKGALVVYPMEYGFLVWVPSLDCWQEEDRARARARGFSQALVDLLDVARKEKCQYLLLDRDGPVYDDLPRFHW